MKTYVYYYKKRNTAEHFERKKWRSFPTAGISEIGRSTAMDLRCDDLLILFVMRLKIDFLKPHLTNVHR